MKKKIIRVALALVILMGLIQLIPVHRNNPKVSQDVDAPPEIKRILLVSCYDCHSNLTKWPLYGYIAPVSWLLAYDVNKGRSFMNFSRWDTYPDARKESFKSEIYSMTSNKIMPLPQYLIMHPKARIDSAGLAKLLQWSSFPNVYSY
jgi:hypothetical protein